MEIIDGVETKQNSNRVVWEVYLPKTNQVVQFQPCKSFAAITPEQILKVLQKAELGVTAETDAGYVNFKFTSQNRCIGFVNFYDNELDEDSTINEVQEVLETLFTELQAVTIDSIRKPLDEESAAAILDAL